MTLFWGFNPYLGLFMSQLEPGPYSGYEIMSSVLKVNFCDLKRDRTLQIYPLRSFKKHKSFKLGKF